MVHKTLSGKEESYLLNRLNGKLSWDDNETVMRLDKLKMKNLINLQTLSLLTDLKSDLIPKYQDYYPFFILNLLMRKKLQMII